MWSNRSMGALIAGALLPACFAVAQAVAAEVPYRVRGTLTAVDGLTLAINTREGKTVSLTLGEKTPVFVVTPATLADLQRGQFVGVTSIEVGGTRIALEVHIFAEALRGLGEGHYLWDLVPEENMMTNAAVAWIEGTGKDRTIRLTYTEGEDKIEGAQTVTVPPEAVVVHFDEATRDLLIPGVHVVGVVTDTEDGGVNPIAIVVGKDGLKPPM